MIVNFNEECFNLEMFCLESSQNINSIIFSEEANLILTESANDVLDSVKHVVIKILDSIAMFIDKVVQQAKKKISGIGFKSAKNIMQKIRESTKDITDNSDIEIKTNTASFITKDQLKQKNLEDLTGISDFTSSTIQGNKNTEFFKQVVKDKSTNAKQFAFKEVIDTLGYTSNTDDVNDLVDSLTKTETVKASQLRSRIGIVEAQLKELDNYMTNGFDNTLKQLLIIRNDMRKQSMTLRQASFTFKFGTVTFAMGIDKKDLARYPAQAASCYSAYVHYLTSYMFKVMRTRKTILVNNINAIQKVLL